MAVVLLCFAVMLEGTGYAGKVDMQGHFNFRVFNHEFFNHELFNPKAKRNHLTMNFLNLIFLYHKLFNHELKVEIVGLKNNLFRRSWKAMVKSMIEMSKVEKSGI